MGIDLIVFSVFIGLFGAVVLLRTHVPLMILATCAGFVLSTLWAPDVFRSLSGIISQIDLSLLKSTISLSLFGVPPLMIGWHFRSSQSKRWLQQIVPAVFWSAFSIAMTIRLLPVEQSSYLESESIIVAFSQSYLNLLVLSSIIVAVVEFMSQHGALFPRRRGRPSK